MNKYNKIAQLSLNQFDALPKTGKPTTEEWTVLSTIVQEDNSNFSVVALGTGSKCIGSSKMCARGTVLNDSHGEIICRRAFIKYLYKEMEKSNSNILTFNTDSNKFKLKEGIKFHFFTTHVPCGDAAIFPKQNSEHFGNCLITSVNNKRKNIEDDNEFTNKRKTDMFRTGAKCLSNDLKDSLQPGMDYHITGVVRTKPGRGDPTLSLSCSDKIAIWCHVGIQGALMLVLLHKPIYLDSFTIVKNAPFDITAAKRSFWERVTAIETLPAHFLEIHQVDEEFNFAKSENKRPSASSMIYSKDCKLEVSVDGKKQGITKKSKNLDCANLSICKLSLFKMFVDIVVKYKIALANVSDLEKLTYSEAKYYACYNSQKQLLLEKGFNVFRNKNVLNFTK